MGTRSRIGIEDNYGKVTSIYCHWDGYPSHNGKILVNHYSANAKARRLIRLGSISVLGEQIGKKIDFDSTSEQRGNQCLAYGRDRGETDVGPEVDETAEVYFRREGAWEEYFYLYREGRWYVGEDTLLGLQWLPVEAVLAKESEEA